MQINIRLVGYVTAVVIASWTKTTTSEVFTSMMKVKRMVTEEENLLRQFKKHIESLYSTLKEIYGFYSDRLKDVRFRNTPEYEFIHPNAIFKTINYFVWIYSNALGEYFEMFQSFLRGLDEFDLLANGNDIEEMCLALLRLQTVYKLNAEDMITGDYRGHQGPQLNDLETFVIGRTAFTDGQMVRSVEWLNLTLNLCNRKGDNVSISKISKIKSLMGRAYLYSGNVKIASELYREAAALDSDTEDLHELMDELEGVVDYVKPEPVNSRFHQFCKLCNLDSKVYTLLSEPRHPGIVCRLSDAFLPYNRFKVEILSISPFVILFYDVITNGENEYLKNRVRNKLWGPNVCTVEEMSKMYTPGYVDWIYGEDSLVVASVTKRIRKITGIKAVRNDGGVEYSADALQVVNYGIGGQYDLEMDTFQHEPVDGNSPMDDHSKMAIFQIYLNDVESGGAKVFPDLGLSVTPVRNMALFWFNSNEKHTRTIQADCPVVVGQKWVANMGISTF